MCPTEEYADSSFGHVHYIWLGDLVVSTSPQFMHAHMDGTV